MVLGWFSGWYSRTKHIQSQEIIMPEASTKKRVWKQEPILHEMMFRPHETTVSTSATKLSKITKWVSKAGLLGFFCYEKADVGGIRRRQGGVTQLSRSCHAAVTKIDMRFLILSPK